MVACQELSAVEMRTNPSESHKEELFLVEAKTREGSLSTVFVNPSFIGLKKMTTKASNNR